jgi:hypothetical protein
MRDELAEILGNKAINCLYCVQGGGGRAVGCTPRFNSALVWQSYGCIDSCSGASRGPSNIPVLFQGAFGCFVREWEQVSRSRDRHGLRRYDTIFKLEAYRNASGMLRAGMIGRPLVHN